MSDTTTVTVLLEHAVSTGKNDRCAVKLYRTNAVGDCPAFYTIVTKRYNTWNDSDDATNYRVCVETHSSHDLDYKYIRQAVAIIDRIQDEEGYTEPQE